MTGFLAELGTKLAERWVARLAVPGALLLAVVATAVVLGHRHALDHRLLADAVTTAAAGFNGKAVQAALVAVAVLVGAGAAGLVVSGLGRAVEALWLATRPEWLWRPLVRLRQRRWHARQAVARRTPTAAAVDRRNRIALAEPCCPTWIGDRLRAAGTRVFHQYALDVTFSWPRLWLLLPEDTRTELTTARAALSRAATLTAWGLLYVAVGAWWWPAALGGTAAAVTGAVQARAAAATLADLLESAFDLHAAELATAVGVPVTDGTVTPAHGRLVSERFRKGA